MIGSCFCEKVVFEIEGEVSSLYQCHCSECRKTTGSTANAGFITSKNRLNWISGKELISTFIKKSGFRVDFCSHCGSQLPNPTSIGEDKIWVPAGLMAPDTEFTVKHHIYVASKADWDIIGAGGIQHDAEPDDINSLID